MHFRPLRHLMISKIEPLPLRRVIPGIRRRLEDWRSRDRWWLGRLVELCGNTVKVDGCTFSLNSPVIDTALKSRFVIGGYENGERAALVSELDPVPSVWSRCGGCLGVISLSGEPPVGSSRSPCGHRSAS